MKGTLNGRSAEEHEPARQVNELVRDENPLGLSVTRSSVRPGRGKARSATGRAPAPAREAPRAGGCVKVESSLSEVT